MSDNAKLFAIGVLAVTAVLMLCAVLVLDRIPASPAYADSPDRGGDYVMVAGRTPRGDQCVYVLDIATQELGAYRADVSNNRIDALAMYHMNKLK